MTSIFTPAKDTGSIRKNGFMKSLLLQSALMKLYNTLTRSKELLKPLKEELVSLYCCGPTVYNYAHIGNLRTYVFEDLLRRALELEGRKVKHVMNITDVGHLTSDNDSGDDKMKKGAEREKKTVWELAAFYANAFFEDMKALNLKMPDETPKATDHIQTMIEQIQAIEENGYSYVGANGNVYFDTQKLADYGKLAQLDKQELQAGARIEVDPSKKHPNDFVLWFVSSKHGDQDMQWDSLWGRGFPGWHIECSAMSCQYLGNQFDIHCGGVDHIPVHHTNELAQAEAANGKKWVNVWMHGEFLVLKNKEKMSKSGENFLTLSTLKEKGFSALDYRYFCLQTHYRKQLMFSWDGLEAAKNGLKRLKNKALSLGNQGSEVSEEWMNKFLGATLDDLNIPQALGICWEMLDDKTLDDDAKLATIEKMDEVLGLKLTEKTIVEIPESIMKLVEKRNEARKNKDWAASDELRNQIEASGEWKVKDGPNGTELETN